MGLNHINPKTHVKHLCKQLNDTTPTNTALKINISLSSNSPEQTNYSLGFLQITMHMIA